MNGNIHCPRACLLPLQLVWFAFGRRCCYYGFFTFLLKRSHIHPIKFRRYRTSYIISDGIVEMLLWRLLPVTKWLLSINKLSEIYHDSRMPTLTDNVSMSIICIIGYNNCNNIKYQKPKKQEHDEKQTNKKKLTKSRQMFISESQ